MKTQWTCACGAVNPAAGRFCELCGAEPLGAGRLTTLEESATEALLKRALCEHVTEPGAMCDGCRAEVEQCRQQIHHALRIWIPGPPDGLEDMTHERKKQRALAQAKALKEQG